MEGGKNQEGVEIKILRVKKKIGGGGSKSGSGGGNHFGGGNICGNMLRVFTCYP